jgi:hypothetical protein
MTDFQQVAESYIAMWNASGSARGELLEKLGTEGVGYTDPLGDVTATEALDATISAVQTQFAGFDVVTTDEAGRITRVLGFLDRVPS